MNKISLYYFDLGLERATVARGENIKLFLVDAGLEHEYIRVPKPTWAEKKEELIKRGFCLPTLPCIELDGEIFGKTIATMRYLSAKLNKYNGSTPEENYYLDVVAESSDVWFEDLKASHMEGKTERDISKYLGAHDKYYSKNGGPYLLGEKIAWVDFLIYHMIDDEKLTENLTGYPNLEKLVKAFEARENIKKYFVSLKANSLA